MLLLRSRSRSLATATKYNFTLPESSFEAHNCPLPSLTISESKETFLHLYTQMVAIRRLETACDQLYKSKLIRGFCHLSTGQEAVAAGMESAITKEDAIITAYRCHGFAYGRGASAKSIIAELMGKQQGSSKGKGGSMHIFAHQFYGGNGIVGAQVPIGAGIALAQQYSKTNTMTFSLYGDGAANQGQVFEAYNMSKLWNLPVVFVCENNKYGMGTSVQRSSASTKYFTRGDYIPGIRVNGLDVLAVLQGCKYARDWTLSDKGPLVIEMVTYRYGGTTYRTREEIQHMRSTSDCIVKIKEQILSASIATEDELKAIDKRIKTEIDEAVQGAREDIEPSVDVLYDDIYAKGSEQPFVRGCASDEGRSFV